MEKILVVDGNSIINRAFYGLQGNNMLKTANGVYTNAIFAFFNILKKYMDEEKPEGVCVAFDMREPTFRHKMYEGYKAKRKGMPDELAVQLPVVKEILIALGIKIYEMPGYEADDILGTISSKASAAKIKSVLLTGDRDSFQLINENVRVILPVTKGGRTEAEKYDVAGINEKYGLTPNELIELKALMGDSSDNIPGVPGVGEKTALELISKYRTIDNLYEKIGEISRASLKDKLEKGKESAYMSKTLATIDKNMPIDFNESEIIIKERDEDKLYELFTEYELKSFIEKYKVKPSESVKTKEKQSGTKVGDFSEYRISTVDDVRKLLNSVNNGSEVFICYDIKKSGNYLFLQSVYFGNKNELFYYEYNDETAEDVLYPVIKGLILKNVCFSGYNLKEFYLYLRQKGSGVPNLCFDEKIASYVLNPSSGNITINELSQKYLGYSCKSSDVLNNENSDGQFLLVDFEKSEINFEEIKAVCLLKEKLEQKLAEYSQKDLFYNIEMPLVSVLGDMEYYGFKVDKDTLVEYSAQLSASIKNITDKIYQLSGEVFNINSSKQLASVLFEKLKLPAVKKIKTGYSTDAEVLEELYEAHEIIPCIIEHRQLTKLLTTYGEGLINVISKDTGRIHSSFNQTVTATGRLSSTEPNLQNIPIKHELGRLIRKAFIPENSGYILLSADYSQIELRILAHIADDKNMKSAFIEGVDIHASTASRVFGVPVEMVTPTQRRNAKAVNFGIVYGIGEYSLGRDIGISTKAAREYIDQYLENYSGVKEYMEKVVKGGEEKGYVTTIFNRRRYIPELKSENHNIKAFGKRVAMNAPIQGSAADIIKIAMINVSGALKEKNFKSRLILQVHDELVVETFAQEKDEVVRIISECMENAASLSVPLIAEVKSGSNWYETK